MFIGERLVFLQLQKAASTRIADLLAGAVGGEIRGHHNRLDFDPGDRIVVGSIRSPWSWYVSLWAFGCQGHGAAHWQLTHRPKTLGNAARRVVVGKPNGTRRDVVAEFFTDRRRPAERWSSLYADPDDADLFREWIKLVMDPGRRFDLGLQYGRSSISGFAGLLTYRYFWLFSRDADVVEARRGLGSSEDLAELDRSDNLCTAMIRVESLATDVPAVLGQAGYSLSSEELESLVSLSQRRTNTSRHAPTGYYYDDETAALVADRERFIIERFGYVSPLAG